MEPQELQSRRLPIGLLCLTFLAVAGVLYYRDPGRTAAIAAMLRVGTLLGALWLAIPKLAQHPQLLKWLPWYLLGGLILIAIFIKYALLLIPLIIATAILHRFSFRSVRDKKNSGSHSTAENGKNHSHEA